MDASRVSGGLRGPGKATRGIAILVTLLLVMLGGSWVPSFIFPAARLRSGASAGRRKGNHRQLRSRRVGSMSAERTWPVSKLTEQEKR
jgi:hypothetical protein